MTTEQERLAKILTQAALAALQGGGAGQQAAPGPGEGGGDWPNQYRGNGKGPVAKGKGKDSPIVIPTAWGNITGERGKCG